MITLRAALAMTKRLSQSRIKSKKPAACAMYCIVHSMKSIHEKYGHVHPNLDSDKVDFSYEGMCKI